MKQKQHGFSLVELVTVMVILGIVSAVAMPRFFTQNDFAEHAFFADTLNALRYANKLAIATGCTVQVAITANSYTLMRQGNSASTDCSGTSNYNLSVRNPGTGESNYTGNEANITLTSSVSPFYFNSLGTVSNDVTLTINGTKTIQVIAATGFVYDNTP